MTPRLGATPRLIAGSPGARGDLSPLRVLGRAGTSTWSVLARAGEEAAEAEIAMASDLAARKYARAVLLDAKLPKDAKSFAKLLEGQFSSFAKKKEG